MPSPYRTNKADRLVVETLLRADVPVWKIAKQIDISEATLRRHYKASLDKAELLAGRKPYEPSPNDRLKVRLLASMRRPQEEIAMFMDLSVDLLQAHFRDELEKGPIDADLKVTANILAMATGPKELKTTATAAIWWSKAIMGWKDVSRVENTGANGGPIEQVLVMLPDNGRGDGPTPIAAPTIEGSAVLELPPRQAIQAEDDDDAEGP